MELHFLTSLDMCSSQDRVRSRIIPSIFTDDDGFRINPEMLRWKDEAFLMDWGVPTKRRVVLVGFILRELAVKKDWTARI